MAGVVWCGDVLFVKKKSINYMILLDDFHQSVRIFSLKLLVRVIFLNIFLH